MRMFAMLRVLVFLLAVAQFTWAQHSYPRTEIFGGGSYIPANERDFPREDSAGFQASLTANLNRWFGITGDFGGQYSNGPDLGPNFNNASAHTSTYEYLAGPRFTKRTERINVFAHALVGGATGRTNVRGFSKSAFAYGGGGGFDIHLNSRIAIRPLQVDYLGSFADILESNIRIAGGVLITLGAK
jgi:opacity protein-like surface antigen